MRGLLARRPIRTVLLNVPSVPSGRILIIGGALDWGTDRALDAAWQRCAALSRRLRQIEIVVVRGFYIWRSQMQLEDMIQRTMDEIEAGTAVIGFSFGGLLARAALVRRGLTGRAVKLLTIATQHSGHLPEIAQVRDRLNLGSVYDLVSVGFQRDRIVPLPCTILPGAEHVALPAGHPSIEKVVEHLGAYSALA